MRQGRILIFGGTSEGRVLCERLVAEGRAVCCSVATEYGRSLLPRAAGLEVLCGRLDRQAMLSLLRGEDFACVVDATHPYAAEVSENLRLATEEAAVPLYRLLRPSEESGQLLWADGPQQAAALLQRESGDVLLTTGSKELSAFAGLPALRERLWVRILPAMESLRLALEAGIPPRRIICMQGPFSVELNVALLRQTGCSIMVSKESGRAGGFLEKAEACRQAGVRLLVLRRPQEEQGYTPEALLALLREGGEGLK